MPCHIFLICPPPNGSSQYAAGLTSSFPTFASFSLSVAVSESSAVRMFFTFGMELEKGSLPPPIRFPINGASCPTFSARF